METTVLKKKKHTYEDYLQTPEGAGYELINGALVEEPSPTTYHQSISGKIGFEMMKIAAENELGEVFIAPCDVFIDDENTVQPDILFISKERLNIVAERYISGAPDLVVEIVSPEGIFRDTVEKKELYEKYGVKEYWIVFPKKEMIQVWLLKNNVYHLMNEFNKDDTIESSVINGLNIKLKDIFSK